MLKDLFDGLASLVFPPHCLLCRQYDRSLLSTSPEASVCLECRHSLLKNVPPFCPKCSRHLRDPEQRFCRSCRIRMPEFDFAWSALIYDDRLKLLLHAFKYHQKTVLRQLFGALMIEFVRTYGLDTAQFDAVMPVPLFPSKERERGFNQSLLLAQEVSANLRIPVRTGVLVKSRPTGNQADLSPKERWTNIKGAFTIRHSSFVRNKNILIIDDLLTTGATVTEAALALKSRGAGTVGVLTLAITP